MAEAAVIRTYLREDLRVGGPNANDNPRVQALIDEGINTWESFKDFKDTDVEDLVKYIRRSGGRASRNWDTDPSYRNEEDQDNLLCCKILRDDW